MSTVYNELREKCKKMVEMKKQMSPTEWKTAREFTDIYRDNFKPESFDENERLFLLELRDLMWVDQENSGLSAVERITLQLDIERIIYDYFPPSYGSATRYISCASELVTYAGSEFKYDEEEMEPNQWVIDILIEAERIYDELLDNENKDVLTRFCMGDVYYNLGLLYSNYYQEKTYIYFKKAVEVLKTVDAVEFAAECQCSDEEYYNRLLAAYEILDFFLSNVLENEENDHYGFTEVSLKLMEAERIRYLTDYLQLKEKHPDEGSDKTPDNISKLADRYEAVGAYFFDSESNSDMSVSAYMTAWKLRRSLWGEDDEITEDNFYDRWCAADDLIQVGLLGDKNKGSKEVMFKTYSIAADILSPMMCAAADYNDAEKFEIIVETLSTAYLNMAFIDSGDQEKCWLNMADILSSFLVDVLESYSASETADIIRERKAIRQDIYGSGGSEKYLGLMLIELKYWEKALEKNKHYITLAENFRSLVGECRNKTDSDSFKRLFFIAEAKCIHYLEKAANDMPAFELTVAALRPEAEKTYSEIADKYSDDEFINAVKLLK